MSKEEQIQQLAADWPRAVVYGDPEGDQAAFFKTRDNKLRVTIRGEGWGLSFKIPDQLWSLELLLLNIAGEELEDEDEQDEEA